MAAVATTVFECDVGRILEDQRRRRAQAREIALTAYFVAAFARALGETRTFADEDGRQIPMIAVESPAGAAGTPVLPHAAGLTLEQTTLALKAPAVTPAEPYALLRHHGLAGSLIVQPQRLEENQLAVLGVGRVRRQVVVRLVNGEEAPRIASQCLLSLSFRRELGLADANALLARCVAELERWPVVGDTRH